MRFGFGAGFGFLPIQQFAEVASDRRSSRRPELRELLKQLALRDLAEGRKFLKRAAAIAPVLAALAALVVAAMWAAVARSRLRLLRERKAPLH